MTTTKQQHLQGFATYLTQNRNLAQGSVKGYLNAIDNFLNDIQDVTTMTKADLIEYVRGYSELSPNTQMFKIASLQSFFGYLADMGFIKEDISRKMPRPKMKKKIIECPTMTEVESLLEEKTDSVAVAIVLGSYCGLRAMEACNARIEDIDFTNNTLKLWNTKTMDSDYIAIPAKAMNVIKKYLEVSGRSTGTILVSKSGNPFQYRNFEKWITKYIPCNYHKLRATCATHISNAREDGIFIAQAQLRHTSINTTQRYVKVDVKRQGRVLDSLF